ncbi:hypothetical protein [uncultured Thiothrix sp.]|uniref:hypothetical protein n=1 Tax=uncultured Thiothrix sp. TaxID=223185 RepID=UPI002623F0D2|nr:hypothetical protein [uncultured Thiothrix sp.]
MKTHYLKSFFTAVTGLLALTSFVMALSSYTRYSTLGIDNEQVFGEQVNYRYYRMWWPGNGALLIGWGESFQTYDPKRSYDVFDPAGTFFRSPHKQPQIQSSWNRIGFWWINSLNPRQIWVGVPAILPALFLLGLWWGLLRVSAKTKPPT